MVDRIRGHKTRVSICMFEGDSQIVLSSFLQDSYDLNWECIMKDIEKIVWTLACNVEEKLIVFVLLMA